MRNLARLSQRLYNTALLIAPEKADVLDGVFRAALEQRYEKIEAEPPVSEMMVAATPFTRTRSGYMRSDNGIALIQVLGPLVQRGAGIDALSGGFESYENIGKQLTAARADPMTRGIMIEFDSPGGEANGVAELAAQIRAADAEKPVVAHANEYAFSAAYWLASAASELYVPASGMVGSVGVVMLHVDQSQMNAKRGLDVTHIVGGARKVDFSPHQPLSESALNNAQAMVDRLYGQFVDAVAAGRDISPDTVRGTEAGLLNPDEAEAIGMIDGTATLDQSIQRLAQLMRDPSQRKSYGRAAASARQLENAMTDKVTPPAAATNTPAAITQADVDAAVLAARADERTKVETEAQAKAAKEAEASAADKAKGRFKAITQSEAAKDRPKLAAHLALETDMSAEAAVAVLAQAAKEAGGNPLDAAMRGKNPRVGADAGTEQTKVVAINSSAIYDARRAQVKSL